jgi:hypothetical protein
MKTKKVIRYKSYINLSYIGFVTILYRIYSGQLCLNTCSLRQFIDPLHITFTPLDAVVNTYKLLPARS